jgi:hypothetical protein
MFGAVRNLVQVAQVITWLYILERKFDQMGFWVSLLLLVGSLQCSVCYEVTIFKTDPSTTSASVDSYYYGLPKKDSSAYWFSNWWFVSGTIKTAFVACT